jgi:putative phosphoribosyl transferase
MTTAVETELRIPIDSVEVEGNLNIPKGAEALVVFVHGSGSSRYSPRNQFVAAEFNREGLGTLLFDLLTVVEEDVDNVTGQYRFDIPLLAHRLVAVTEWLKSYPETVRLKLGFFGASTGAAAALIAAAKLPMAVSAVVSRGGRPDLASEYLPMVEAPTLFLVGGWDEDVLMLNRKAQAMMRIKTKLVVVEEATHLFEEPGKLEEVAAISADWFKRHLNSQK